MRPTACRSGLRTSAAPVSTNRLPVATRNGSIYVAGDATSTDLPKTPNAWLDVAPPTPLQRSTFVSIVSGDGRSLIASSVFGGEANDFVRTMAVAADGTVLLG